MKLEHIAVRIASDSDFWKTESEPTEAELSTIKQAIESCSSTTKALVCIAEWLSGVGDHTGSDVVLNFAQGFSIKEESEL